jgi:8-oxo-dGTP pyrophosphatase MutT (NUDIX family)
VNTQISPTLIDQVRGLASAGEPCGTSANAILALIDEAGPDAGRRTLTTPGHLTASAIVLSPALSSVLLINHKKLKRWLQPGGHIEPSDKNLVSAAQREAVEETGVHIATEPTPELVWVDVHEIPPHGEEPAHLHHDLMFGMVATDDFVRESAEAPQIAWAAFVDLTSYGVPAALQIAAARTRALFAEVRTTLQRGQDAPGAQHE